MAIRYANNAKQVIEIKRKWARNPGFLEKVGSNITVFFMGNSKITSGLIPDEFDQRMNGTVRSYNLALPALPLAPHYFMLKEYLKNNPPPQYIIMTLHPGRFENKLFTAHGVIGAGLGEAIWYSYLAGTGEAIWNYLYPMGSLWPSLKKAMLMNSLALLPDHIRQKHRASLQEKLGLSKRHWAHLYAREKPGKILRQNLYRNRGYYSFSDPEQPISRMPDDYVPPQLQEKPVQEQDPDPPPDPFVDMFFALNEKIGTKVVLIYDYTLGYKGCPEAKPRPHPDLWYDLKRKYKNVFFLTDKSDRKYYRPAFFSDRTHLNPDGARLFTRYIASGFAEFLKRTQQKQ